MRYRAEIDGLRALAVIPVILFHADFDLFGGGFVGVDVFFVISGYLITSIILNEMDEDKFSLVNFYERRARRILPALFFIMLMCLPFAWLLMMQRDFENFSLSLAATSTFSSNILFWREAGYFNPEATLQPLLHTWSLAVEEQYYILFPLFLLLVWQLGKRWILIVLAIGFVLSLGIAHWGAYNVKSATFFLLPTRGWELLIGAFAAFFMQHKSKERTDSPDAKTFNQSASLIGLALIGYAIFIFDDQTPFPSLYTLVPTIGVVLVILFGVKGTLVSSILGNRWLVGIGLISYSAYLWHQPLFAFVKYRAVGEPNGLIMAMLCAIVLPLAYITWRYVETPFRLKHHISRKAVLQVCSISALGFVVFGLIGTTKETAYIPALFGKKSVSNEGARVMLLGDSHASHLKFGLQHKLGPRVVNRAANGCIPFYNVDRYDKLLPPGRCPKKMKAALDEFKNNQKISTLVLSMMGPIYLDGTAFKVRDHRMKGLGVVLVNDASIKDRWKVFEVGMRNTLKRLTDIPNKHIVFALDVPELGMRLRFCGVSKRSILGTEFWYGVKHDNCAFPRKEFEDRVARYHNLVRRVLSEFPSVHLFDPTNLFCRSDKCIGTWKKKYLYKDPDHLSDFGSLYVAAKLAPIILNTLNKESNLSALSSRENRIH